MFTFTKEGRQLSQERSIKAGGGGTIQKAADNPVECKSQPAALKEAPRCLARTRRGTSCQSPAMPNGRCRLHGGKSPGAPLGNRNAWKHGLRSAEYRMRRKLLRDLRHFTLPR
ncbi:HGGxSTG domain-containing protein [Sphingomicrobium flavum]|uniref:HGGxSTG domain-containing protein n=1 Tax=Sphingomicrobium flavum TaxID=1229164 RepID=UPI0035E3C55D